VVHDRIRDHFFEVGHYPHYVVASPEMWDRIRLEVQYLDFLHPGAWQEEWPDGVQGYVILDFGDEIITADGEAHGK
jgi:hypothetical protein